MKFTVNGYNWEMIYCSPSDVRLNPGDNACLGLTQYLEQQILIRTGLSERMTRTTVIHELCHCFLFCYGSSVPGMKQEAMCDFMGNHADAMVELADKFLRK